MILGKHEYDQDNDESPDNCAACRKKLEKERQKNKQLANHTIRR